MSLNREEEDVKRKENWKDPFSSVYPEFLSTEKDYERNEKRGCLSSRYYNSIFYFRFKGRILEYLP